MLSTKTSKKFDLHTHHYRCGHAVGSIKDYVEEAIKQGLDIIGISDHSPFFNRNEDHPHPNTSMAKNEFKAYVDEVLQIKKEYEKEIEVLLGIESDFFLDKMENYQKQFSQYPFDYIIGSVHFVDGVKIFRTDQWKETTYKQKVNIKERYYKLIQASAKSGHFQILGHIDAMKGFYPEFSLIKTDVVADTLKIIAQNNITIEINTSGKTKDCGGWYPADDILEMALHYGVDVTFGSDAHVPNRVGDDFDLVQQKLKDIGFKRWCYFRKQEKIYQTI